MTKTRWDTTFNETRQVLSDTLDFESYNQGQKQDGTLYSGKQGKCFHQDTLDFECYNQGV